MATTARAGHARFSPRDTPTPCPHTHPHSRPMAHPAPNMTTTETLRRLALGHSCRVVDVWIEAPTAEHEGEAREPSLTLS